MGFLSKNIIWRENGSYQVGEGGVLSEERGEAEVEVGRGQLHLQSPQVGHRVEGAGLK